MALSKQKIPINLGQGIDTKTDPKHVVPGKLKRLSNGVFTRRGRIDKRNGHDLIENVTVDGTELNQGDSLAKYRNELLQYNGQNLYSLSSNANKWVDKGSAISVVTKTKQIVNNTAEQTQVDSAINGGVGLYAWEDSRGGVRASIVDETTGVPMLTDVSIDASATRARCLAFKSYLYVYYYKSGSLYARRINPKEPTAFDAAVEISDTVNTSNPTYDILNYANIRMIFAHNVQGASEIKLGFVDENPTVLAGVLAPKTISEAATDSIAIIQGTSQKIILAYYNSTDKLRATILNNGGTTLVSPATIDSIATTVRNITGYNSDDDETTLLYEIDETLSYNKYVKQNTFDEAGNVGTPAVFKRSVGLWTKCFTYVDSSGSAQNFVGVVHDSTLQATYFVIRSDGVIASKQLYSLASGVTLREILQNVSVTDSIFSFSCLKKNRLVSQDDTVYTPTGVSKTTLDFTNNDIFTAAELGDTLHIVGGVLSMYDGESIVEHGFHLYPENITTATAATGGSISDGETCTAVFLYEWYDNNGRIHRSAPSLAATQITGGAGASHTVTYTVPTLRLTAKDGTNRTGVKIVGYILSGSVYYRFTDVDATPNNDVTTDTVNIVLDEDPDQFTANEILYTTGGVLDNYAAPANSTIAVFNNRIFLGGLEEGGEVWFSKENQQGAPVEFNDTLKKAFQPDGGRDTGFGVLDDKLILFKSDRFFYTFGDGPNNLGFDGSFSEFQFVTGDVGTENANSVVVTPLGLMIKSVKGIYLIDRALSVNYIGAEVEEFNNLTVTSSVLVADKNQVRFTTETGPILVYDYFFNNWSSFSGLSAKRAVNWLGNYVVMKQDGTILKDNPNIFTDAGSSYALGLETGWLAVDGIGGFQRLYQLQIRGDYLSKHDLQVRCAYDYSTAYESEVVIDADNLLEANRYGDNSPYGSENVFGGVNSAYRFSVYMQRQKCESIRFSITEFPDSSESQRGLNISDIILLVGIKGGASRLRTQQTVGAAK